MADGPTARPHRWGSPTAPTADAVVATGATGGIGSAAMGRGGGRP